MAKDSNSPVELLHNAGLRRTPVRTSVLKTLSEAKSPLTAQQILKKLPEGTDNVTLYRTLTTLIDKKLLHRVPGEDRNWRYGIGNEQDRHQHAHFVCDECGTMECLPDSPLSDMAAKRLGVRPGYRVNYSEIVMHGSCPQCRH
jgi:Fur family ferric uptake transcriptional regulator